MNKSATLHLALALDGSGWHPAAWREPDAMPTELFRARYWLELVQEAERGLLDLVTIEDSHRMQKTAAGDPDEPVGTVVGRLDAVMVAARVAPLTRHVGIVPAASTIVTEPFLLSTQIATLDFATRGRAGWLARVGTRSGDAGYVGPRGIPGGEAVFDEAAEHVEVVRRLWDSWEDGAEIRDVASNRFFDRAMVHHIDFEGTCFSVKGPSITPRPPQGQPIVAVAADGRGARSVAAQSADVVFVAPREEHDVASTWREIADAVTAAERSPAGVRVLADVVVFLDTDSSAAIDRKARLDALDGGPSSVAPLTFVGAPEQLAERLIGWRESGYCGFRLRPGAIPRDLQAITRLLVPELQRRGAFRRDYEASTLRGLLGFGRPANRYDARTPAANAVA